MLKVVTVRPQTLTPDDILRQKGKHYEALPALGVVGQHVQAVSSPCGRMQLRFAVGCTEEKDLLKFSLPNCHHLIDRY